MSRDGIRFMRVLRRVGLGLLGLWLCLQLVNAAVQAKDIWNLTLLINPTATAAALVGALKQFVWIFSVFGLLVGLWLYWLVPIPLRVLSRIRGRTREEGEFRSGSRLGVGILVTVVFFVAVVPFARLLTDAAFSWYRGATTEPPRDLEDERRRAAAVPEKLLRDDEPVSLEEATRRANARAPYYLAPPRDSK